jgi:DNA-binding transcriptional ArsR family regulator
METMNLPTDGQDLSKISTIMQAISHPMRLKIIGTIGHGEKIVTHIMEEVGSSQSNVSQHVEVLRKAGIVQSRRDHNRIYCSIANMNILTLLTKVRECYCNGREGVRTSHRPQLIG